ncbi:hypothetical protein BN1211_0455 [Cyberlindnera jadinii]|uniref:Myosin N-terminal SH3-like domain-containing protein n=1 Tax=Cyberlindnera jadinii (strain ATCC 18201 / CBS 1600 / BCRC 20928 / JCM 3617 / NBRC 0987 / NRRL Y-1542) TaxID=983966 RepID=A0A0H5BZB9_CYBJN|nr:hypothetical protein BN1211_0455 [Cyberlindnera jadinii]
METTKNLVWVPDKTEVFKKGYVVEPVDDDKVKVRFDDGSEQVIESSSIEEVNPAKFDKADDIAELTYLNEPSVLLTWRRDTQTTSSTHILVSS